MVVKVAVEPLTLVTDTVDDTVLPDLVFTAPKDVLTGSRATTAELAASTSRSLVDDEGVVGDGPCVGVSQHVLLGGVPSQVSGATSSAIAADDTLVRATRTSSGDGGEAQLTDVVIQRVCDRVRPARSAISGSGRSLGEGVSNDQLVPALPKRSLLTDDLLQLLDDLP
ncbi:MAG TPA: hypothetical protein VM942_09545 [Acidimicrobiales bacterium]|nr:hypothetical protein [Acidimicrobiales bacterium]